LMSAPGRQQQQNMKTKKWRTLFVDLYQQITNRDVL